MDFKDIAALSGKNGLFKIVKPTRNGVILESLEASPKKLIANSNNKISILKEISVYTTGATENLPLDEIFYRIRQKHVGELPVNAKSHPEDLKDFLSSVVPDFDKERVYPSDIKKIVSWYSILSKELPEILTKAEEQASEEPAKKAESEEKPAKKAAKASKSASEEASVEKEPKAPKATAKPKKAKES